MEKFVKVKLILEEKGDDSLGTGMTRLGDEETFVVKHVALTRAFVSLDKGVIRTSHHDCCMSDYLTSSQFTMHYGSYVRSLVVKRGATVRLISIGKVASTHSLCIESSGQR